MTGRNWILAGVAQVLLAWLAQPAQAAERMKVAMMDQQQVIERSMAGKRALEDLKSYSTTRQKIIDSDDQELKELEKGVQDANLSEEVRKEKQEHFRTKLEAYQRRIQDFNREVQEKQRAMVAEYAQKIHDGGVGGGSKRGVYRRHRQRQRCDGQDRALQPSFARYHGADRQGVRSAEQIAGSW